VKLRANYLNFQSEDQSTYDLGKFCCEYSDSKTKKYGKEVISSLVEKERARFALKPGDEQLLIKLNKLMKILGDNFNLYERGRVSFIKADT
jgi:hypothetical protein